MSEEEESVLSRWSRLKRGEPRADEAASGAADPGATGVTAEGAAETQPADTGKLLTEEDLPDIATLNYDSDFSVFLQKNVPDYLHKLALRKLWHSDPVLANLDGLNDYDLDYTISEIAEIAAQSAEDLARGTKRLNVSDLRAQEREARQAQAQRKGQIGAGPEGGRGVESAEDLAAGEADTMDEDLASETPVET
jgi:hypothetical protein